MITRAKWVAALAILILAGASSGVALAIGSYKLALGGVPQSAERGKAVDYTVHATVPVNVPYQAVFVTVWASETTACAATTKEEMTLARENKARSVAGFNESHRTVSQGTFSKPFSFTPERTGTHHLCAYMDKDFPGGGILAKAQASFSVRPKPLPRPPK